MSDAGYRKLERALVECDCPEGYLDQWDCLALQLEVPVSELDGDPASHGCDCECHQR